MLNYLLKSEKIQLPCWLPVLIGIGILIRLQGFILNTPIIVFLSISFFISTILFQNNYIRLISIICCSILLGYLALDYRYKSVDAPIFPYNDKFSVVQGVVENIVPLESGYRIILSNVKIEKLSLKKTPKKVRLTVRTDIGEIKSGNLVKVKAILSKPMQPYIPNTYNFARDAYFKQIGAVGYTVSNFEIINTASNSFMGGLNKIRNNIQRRVIDSIGVYDGSIVTALMINEYSNIDKNVLKNLRATGLAHILSVSGMHLSLVAAIFFVTSRFILNLFPSIALRIHCKKIAAFISLLGSFGYLLISGMEVAAIRSFIMASMVIIAIIIDRSANPMRAISWAATIILFITPENIVHPSFQMSFAAVLALISSYELFMKIKFDFSEFNILQKGLFYFFSVAFSSLIAGLATAPFALYHFGQTSNYSILANLLAVPITSFWLMPMVVVTFLLYPLHLEFLSLNLMKFGVIILIKIANYIAGLPSAVSYFAKVTDLNIIFVVIGFLWLCIWNTRIRLLGILFITIGIILQSLVLRPDIFIDWDRKTIAVVDQDKNQLIFLKKPLVRFKKQLLLGYLGISRAIKYKEQTDGFINCKQNICFFSKDNYQVKIDLDKMLIQVSKNNVSNKTYQEITGTEFIYLK